MYDVQHGTIGGWLKGDIQGGNIQLHKDGESILLYESNMYKCIS